MIFTMSWKILAVLVCHLCLLICAAPQLEETSIAGENTIRDRSNATAALENLPENSTKVSTEETSPEAHQTHIEAETGTPIQDITVGESVINKTIVEELVTPKEEKAETMNEELSEEPPETITTESVVSKRPNVTSYEKPTTKPDRPTSAKPLEEESSALVTSPRPPIRYPCRCGSGICSCCTGVILENFNVPIRSRACANVTYQPEDFAFNFKLLFNNRLLYSTQMSAKNPRPVCIPLNRFFGVKMCAKLSNVYLSGRNMHACLDMEGYWDDESAFQYSFNCFRIGSNGIAVVRPEDGGGLSPPPDEEEQTDEDYDDSARELTYDTDVNYVAYSQDRVSDKIVQN